MASIAVTVCSGAEAGLGEGGHWQAVKQEMSKIQIFFKLNLKTLGFARAVFVSFYFHFFLFFVC